MRVLICIAAALAIQGKIYYQDPDKMVRLYNHTNADGQVQENGDIKFTMQGVPATVESRLDGLTVTAPSFSGIVTPGKRPPGADQSQPRPKTIIKELDATGSATVTLDTEMRYQALVENAAKLKKDAPKEPTGKTLATLLSELFEYRGTALEGTLTVPKAFTLNAVSDGKSKNIEFHQTLKASGTKGFVTLDPNAPEGVLPIRRGTLTGPIMVRIDRTETQAGKPDQTSWMEGTADNIDVDFTDPKARTIILSGNVKMNGEGGIFIGSSEADSCVITVDENLNPIWVKIKGSPITDRFKEKKSGGGGR